MGFYGNITNTSNTTFQFDRIYPNRLAMEANVNNDGIFIGRYVLVEYDQKAAISNIYINTNTVIDTLNNIPCYYGYSSPNVSEVATRIKYGGTQRSQDKSVDKYYQGEFGQVQITLKDDYGTLQEAIQFYQCIGEKDGYALFVSKTKANATENNYIKNFAIDEGEYSKVSNGFKGYDSTVWTKVTEKSENGILITKYVNIADLNSVVPTFDIAADAPTMTPITPHFDADSTNVYYKLHMQTPYGFRVAKGTEGQADDKTVWYKTTYIKDEDKTKTEKIYEGWADIYYNKAGFDPKNANSKVANEATDNYIKLEPTGESQTVYAHGGRAKDIQEFSLHLPAIGNMMSDAWDIIHGKGRNDFRGDGENASLQGRLDAFEDIEINQIPVKREKDGTLVGSKINNGIKYNHSGDILDKTIPNSATLSNDDPWIKTNIDTNSLVGGTVDEDGNSISQAENNGILIQHTFHATEDSTTSLDKNTGETVYSADYKDKHIPAIKDSSGNIILSSINAEKGNVTDYIKLYTPYVDATGHVVGKNIETVKLPHGFKTFTTNGINEYTGDLYTDITIANDGNNTEKKNDPTQVIAIADNTQDSLEIYTQNKWIQTKLEGNGDGQDGDKLTIAHEIHAINTSSHGTTNANEEENAINENNINIPDWKYDEAGHIVEKHDHHYTLPFGYKYITTNGLNTNETKDLDTPTIEIAQANSTTDTFNIDTVNKWIQIEVTDSDNRIKIAHELHEITNNVTTDTTDDLNNPKNNQVQNTVNIPDWSFDNAGHIIHKSDRAYTLPYGYKTIKINNSPVSQEPANNIEENGQMATNTQDTLTLNASNKWIVLDNSEDRTIKFGHSRPFSTKQIISPENTNVVHFGDSFNLINFLVDEAGHVTQYHENEITITIPQGDHENINNTDSDGNVIPTTNLVSSIELDKPSGTITARYNTTNSVKLSGYETNKNNNHSTDINAIADNDTLNTAFAKLQNQIDNEIKLRKAAIDTLYYGEESPDGVKIAETFDTIKEIADFLEQDASNGRTGVEIIIDDIATLKGDNTVSGSVANSIKNAIEGLDSSKSADTNKYISGITITDGKITDIAQTTIPVREVTSGIDNGTILVNNLAINVGGLKSAAYTESSAYAKADVLDTKFDYGTTEQKTIADLMNKVAELETELNKLKDQINPPQEPDEGGETV